MTSIQLFIIRLLGNDTMNASNMRTQRIIPLFLFEIPYRQFHIKLSNKLMVGSKICAYNLCANCLEAKILSRNLNNNFETWECGILKKNAKNRLLWSVRNDSTDYESWPIKSIIQKGI